MTYTATIRQRGQLTIPDKVREVLSWLQTGEVVGIDIDDDEVRIRPQAGVKKRVDWDKLWRGLERCRTYKSKKKGEMSGSEFIAMDRYNH